KAAPHPGKAKGKACLQRLPERYGSRSCNPALSGPDSAPAMVWGAECPTAGRRDRHAVNKNAAVGVRSAGITRYHAAAGSGMDEHDLPSDDGARQTAALMGFIVILVLAIAGVVLVRELRDNASLEDCLMSGRRNCAP